MTADSKGQKSSSECADQHQMFASSIASKVHDPCVQSTCRRATGARPAEAGRWGPASEGVAVRGGEAARTCLDTDRPVMVGE